MLGQMQRPSVTLMYFKGFHSKTCHGGVMTNISVTFVIGAHRERQATINLWKHEGHEIRMSGPAMSPAERQTQKALERMIGKEGNKGKGKGKHSKKGDKA